MIYMKSIWKISYLINMQISLIMQISSQGNLTFPISSN